MTDSDRVEAIENDLDAVKQILFTVARRHEASQERMDRIERVVEQLAADQHQSNLRIDRLGERVDQLASTVNNLSEQFQASIALAEQDRAQAEIDRNQAAIDRAAFNSTVQSILETLSDRFTSN